MTTEYKISTNITVIHEQNLLTATFQDKNGRTVFNKHQITFGIRAHLTHQDFIETIQKVGQQKIHGAYLKKPQELRIFEAERPMIASTIAQGIKNLKKAAHSQDPFSYYEKSLEMFKTALKLQIKLKGATQDLEAAIREAQKQRNFFRCKQQVSLCLSEDEVRALENTLSLCVDEDNLFEALELFIEGESKPHHHFLRTVLHEEKKEYLLAMEAYFLLSEDLPRQASCVGKAHQNLRRAAKNDPQLSLRLGGAQMLFEEHLARLSQQAKFPAPTCFISFSLTEKEVGHWLEKRLVPDMDTAGIKPIVSFRDLSHGAFLDNFQNLASSADAAVVVCTPEFKAKYEERKKAPVGIAMEVKIIEKRLEDTEKSEDTFFIYLNGDRKEVLPTDYFNQHLAAKFGFLSSDSFEFDYFINAFSLLGAIRQIPKETVRKVTDDFLLSVKKILHGTFDPQKVEEWKKTQQDKKKLS